MTSKTRKTRRTGNHNYHPAPPTAYMTVKQLADRYQVCNISVYRWVREGKFPKPIKLVGATRWRMSDVLAWEAEQQGAE